MRLYHGTSYSDWKKIQQMGFIPPVWFSTSLEQAKIFKELNELSSGEKGAMLYVDLPKHELKNLRYDNAESAYLFQEKDLYLLKGVDIMPCGSQKWKSTKRMDGREYRYFDTYEGSAYAGGMGKKLKETGAIDSYRVVSLSRTIHQLYVYP